MVKVCGTCGRNPPVVVRIAGKAMLLLVVLSVREQVGAGRTVRVTPTFCVGPNCEVIAMLPWNTSGVVPGLVIGATETVRVAGVVLPLVGATESQPDGPEVTVAVAVKGTLV